MSGVRYVSIKFEGLSLDDLEPHITPNRDEDRVITDHCIIQELLDILQCNGEEHSAGFHMYHTEYLTDVYNFLSEDIFDGYSVHDVKFNMNDKLVVVLEKD